MPHRLVSLALLLFWMVTAVALFRKDVLPYWIVGPPPDLRTIARTQEDDGPVRWSILRKEAGPGELYRPIGKIITRSTRRRDGSVRWSSEATFDAAEFAGNFGKRPPGVEPGQGSSGGDMLVVSSQVDIDPVGDLFHLQATVRTDGGEELLVLEGRVEQNELIVTTNSPLPLLRTTKTLPYRARGMVENPLAPIDRMPGLRVGQRWESQMADPLTGTARVVRCEVVGQEMLHAASSLTKTHVVLTRLAVPPLSFRTWVRSGDGLVLRQEVPYPLAPLLLERQPDAPKEPLP